MRHAILALALALAALAGCDQVLDIHDHSQASDAGTDGSGTGSSGANAGCNPCVLDTSALDDCCVQ